MMLELSRSEIHEDLLTLEDVALLADPQSQIPKATIERLRQLVRSDPRLTPHYDFLEALAEQAQMPESDGRLYVGLRCLEDLERLVQVEDWQHPAEVLDPTGEKGISYAELIRFVRNLARRDEKGKRYLSVERRLERAWSKEKAGDDLVERFAARLCEYPAADAERLLRQAARRYGLRRQAVESGGMEE